MAIFLPDVNMLLAIAWPNSIHHQVAHNWLGKLSSDSWATCAITQVGFVRISSNPQFISTAVAPLHAMGLLKKFISDPRHVFWESAVQMVDPSIATRRSLKGHRQVTDAYLFALCLKMGGKLVTLDQGIESLALTDAERQTILTLGK
jgi:toxin-antitoxin system PIN domain toxin